MHIELMLRSVAAQSLPPALHVVVDDGSRDDTFAVAERLARELPWLRVVRVADRGHRALGGGVVAAFEAGLAHVRLADFDYVCKLDADLELPVRYFEELMQHMEHDPRLGAVSGKPCVRERDGRLAPEPCGDDVCVGAAKFFRRQCYEEVGGFVRGLMWDGIDAHTCRMLGWRSHSLDLPGLRFVHLRVMGSSDRGLLRGRMRWGRGQYFMGTGPLYMAASMLFRLPARPPVIGSLCMGWGWLRAWLRRDPRYERPGFRRFLRRYHRHVLLFGKRRACEMSLAPRADISGAAKPIRKP